MRPDQIGPIRLAARERTLPTLLKRQAAAYGARQLVGIGAARFTHAEAMTVAARRAGALAAAGIRRGDRVAVMASNRLELLETFLGCGWIGAVCVPLNTASMGPQIGYVLADSGARLLVIERGLVVRLARAGLARSALETIWLLDHGGKEGDATARPAAIPWPAPGPALEAADVSPGDTLAILYTSGTTGPPKGVQCPHAQYTWWGDNSADILGVRADDVLVTTLPLFHINALNTFAQAALTGCRVVFEARFSASGFWPRMADHGASVAYLLGAMVPILLAQPAGEAERKHRVRIALGPGVPEAAAREFRQRTGVALIDGYGSTETNFVIAAPADSPRGGIMGWLRPGFEARVVDADDAPLPIGEAGELVLRASEPFAFASGYHGMPDKTVEAWRNLWFHTGDRVVREADGALRFIDRIKDAIRRRGENISSWEVEQVLLAHPAIAEAAAFPVQSELAEDEVMVALVPRQGMTLDPAEVARFCEGRLPYFAIPRYIDVVDDLPRTENGKVRKFVLRERGKTKGTWVKEAVAGRH